MWTKKKGVKILTEAFLVLILIASGSFLLTYKLDKVAVTDDEGYYYLGASEYLVKNFRWDKEFVLLHPPLPYYLSGWSLLVFPTLDPDTRLLIARLSTVPIFILFALFIYILLRRWYGVAQAFFGTSLYLFNPEVLSHARLITADHLFALTTFLTLATFYFFMQKPESWRRRLLVGLSLGLCLLSKVTSLLLLPLLVILGIFYWFRFKKSVLNILVGSLIVISIALLLLHAGYFFRESGRVPERFLSPQMKTLTNIPGVKPLLVVLFPRAFLQGTDYQIYESTKGVWWGYFAGKYYWSGLWYYYPVVFLIKTPIPILIFIFLTSLLLFFRKLKTPPFLSKLILVTVLWFFVYFMFFNKLIIGLRYLLMVYPLLFVYVAPLVQIKFARSYLNGLYRIGFIFLLVWYIGGTLRMAPFYMAFFNETIGGPKNAWKYVADSSLDWNQDNKFFAEYQKNHPEIVVVNPLQPTAGIIAVKVNDMNLFHYDEFAWLRKLNKDPIDYIGYTWLIFDVKQEDLINPDLDL